MTIFQCPNDWSLQQRLDHDSVRDPETGCILWPAGPARDDAGGRGPAILGRIA
jgi:hypothetical protein